MIYKTYAEPNELHVYFVATFHLRPKQNAQVYTRYLQAEYVECYKTIPLLK